MAEGFHLCEGHESSCCHSHEIQWSQFPLFPATDSTILPTIDSTESDVIMIFPLGDGRYALPLRPDNTCLLKKWDCLDLRYCFDWDTTRSCLQSNFLLCEDVMNRCLLIKCEDLEDRNLVIGMRFLQKTLFRCIGQYGITISAYKQQLQSVVDEDIVQSLDNCGRIWSDLDRLLADHMSHPQCADHLEEAVHLVGY